MSWIWFIFLAPVLAIVGQWGFYVVRFAPMADRKSNPQGTALSDMKLLVVYGREVSSFGRIEGRFQLLLDEAATLIRIGRFDRVVLLGGDHHGNGKPYAETARAYLMNLELDERQIMTPADKWIKGRWAFSCSQELDTARWLQHQGANVIMLGESQRSSRYFWLETAKGISVQTILVPSAEPPVLWFIAFVLMLVDPNENHVLRGMNRFKRWIVTARDRRVA